jgi:hypothetical protein
MNYFVLFSVALIVGSVIILVSPLNHRTNVMPIQEGFDPKSKAKSTSNSNSQPTAAGQFNLSRSAGMADGSSSNQHLLDHLLKKHDRLAEAFENRDADKSRSRVSATTTKKKGVASTGADYEGDNVPIPVAGCNKDKCMQIKDPMNALDGNCINATYPNGEPNYKIKYCPAWEPKDDTTYAQECVTCGYYEYEGICSLKDRRGNPDKDEFIPTPQNPSNCDYESYTFKQYNDEPMPGTDDGGGDDGGGGDDSGNPSCSTCKLQVNKTTKCVLPSCYSADDGYLPFPDDDGYNFAEGCFYYNPDPSKPDKTLQGMAGRDAGYYCPPITQGESYDAGGGSGDPCYTTSDGSLNYAAFVQMKKACSNDKAPSKQEFVPEDVDDNPLKRNTKDRIASAMLHQHQHQHGGSINVYHHHHHGPRSSQPYKTQGDKQSGNQRSGNQRSGNQRSGNQRNGNQQSGNQQSGNQQSNGQSSTYQEPVAGATVLGFL